MDESCRLCGRSEQLRDSHILPAFAFKAMRARSATGHIRHSDAPNRRVQDGLKERWLCNDCEILFSRDERMFANKLYLGGEHNPEAVAYEEWLLRFCTSVSWRVLTYCRGRNRSTRYSALRSQLLTEAEIVWRDYLLGKRPTIGKFRQNLLQFGLIENTTIDDLPKNINRFLVGGISMDIVGSSRTLYTWAKLGRFQILGVVQARLGDIEGAEIRKEGGFFPSKRIVLPRGFLDLLREKAEFAGQALSSMSDSQIAKIDQTFRDDPERFYASEQFPAIEADARMFGVQAVVRKTRTT